MKIFPAIDLSGGQVVRLREGNYADMQVYGDAPLVAARSFMEQGASHLHVVDLDGAKEGEPRNADAIRLLCALPGLFVQVGGGIRNERRIAELLSLGAARVILGTAAVQNFPFVEEMVKKYGRHIAVGVDAREGKVAVSGWLKTTRTDAFAFCRKLANAGVKTVIYTDISRDGNLGGANLAAYQALKELPLDIVASGGISFAQELMALRTMGTYGAIIGKALYEKKLNLTQCISLAEGRESL
ncbi:MAG: 1-(5-phosphoribosyl)-5-[(5-phosphoribosylamino)methylideneamino]imidazole-4-carboxamide isomerase [Clostridia bacterium]|nr:1-(5-phosphoribosyl)-5-[(5-phosphoribosylamino)methylideneamino]imidazole-4-carboxamide isomerase [Clostridia bacterium]